MCSLNRPLPTTPALVDPFGGTPDNWSLSDSDSFDRDVPADPWPPVDADELAALNAWMDEQDRQYTDE
jgi:hypothetical protein